MEKEEIKKLLKEKMVTDIESVVSGENQEVDLYGVSPNAVTKHLESIGFKCNDIETNGWSWDFYIVARYDGKKYVAGGSGYYSDSIHFRLEED